MFLGDMKRNIDPEWVKQLQYRRQRDNLILLSGNASSSIVKQNDCKNKITWLTQKVLPKSFSLFYAICMEDIEEIFRGSFFRSKLVFKFSKHVDLKIVNDPKIGWHVKWKKITAMELEIRNLSLRIKSSFLKIPHFFAPESFIPYLLSLVHISELKLFALKWQNYSVRIFFRKHLFFSLSRLH